MKNRFILFNDEGEEESQEAVDLGINTGDRPDERVLWITGDNQIEGHNWQIEIDLDDLFKEIVTAIRRP